MKKVYQRIVDPVHGDCMQAAIASLLELEYEATPQYIELGCEWFEEICRTFYSAGCEFDGMFHNKIWRKIRTPNDGCFELQKFHRPSMLTKSNLKKSGGVNGLFFATVLSPKFFSWRNEVTHAVICDSELNIVHDPNPSYQNILQYPLADVIGCNGIIQVYDFKTNSQ